MIRTLIVDDEAPAREGLRIRLSREPDIAIVGEAASGREAVDAITALAPDLVVLDVQMPGMNGFEVLASVAPERRPYVIFATAYDDYALRAFETSALDYLLKPIGGQRLRDALDRARREVQRDDREATHRQLTALLQQVGVTAGAGPSGPVSVAPTPPHQGERRLAVRDGERYLMLDYTEIAWVEASRNYVLIHARDRVFRLRTTLQEFEATLPAGIFARIHRSTLVNVRRVTEVHPDWRGDFDVVLADGTRLRMSRNYRERLLGR